MTKAIVEWRPQVQSDLYEIATYIARDNVTAATSFLEAVELTLDDLALNPELGRMRSFKNVRLINYRVLPVRGFHNYVIFYELSASEAKDVVLVVRVLHAARDIDSMF